jgi:uncharacterized protein (DUF736 family)
VVFNQLIFLSSIVEQKMPVIGLVRKQADGSYKGELRTLTITAPLEIRPNAAKGKAVHADFIVYSRDLEIGEAWHRALEDSKGRYVAVTLTAPEFGRKRLSARLTPADARGRAKAFTLLWHPESFPRE